MCRWASQGCPCESCSFLQATLSFRQAPTNLLVGVAGSSFLSIYFSYSTTGALAGEAASPVLSVCFSFSTPGVPFFLYPGCARVLQVTLFFSESPTNPCLRCIDIERVASLCHAHGTIVCVDCTFATPINQQAIPLGADLILHSATKYFAGHHDVSEGMGFQDPKPETLILVPLFAYSFTCTHLPFLPSAFLEVTLPPS